MKKERLQRHTLKFLSGLLALSLWYYVANSGPIEIERKLSVQYLLPSGTSLMSMNEKQVILKLKGPKAFIGNVFTKKEKYIVDLKPYYKTYGKKFKIKFISSHLELPFGVEVLDIIPKDTTIEIDQVGMIEMPVKVQFFGDLGKNRRLKEFRVNPDTIMIKGPITLLRNISRVDTLPLNLAILNKDEGEVDLPLTPLDSRFEIDRNLKVTLEYKTKTIK